MIEWGPPHNSVVECKSADNQDSLLGEAIDWVIYSEASKLPRAIRERYVQPRTITRKGRELIPTTPSPEGEWVHELWEYGQTGEFEDIESFSWDFTANPLYDESEFLRAKNFYGADNLFFREQYMGEWVFFGGLVYPLQEVHVIQPFKIPANWPVYRGIDFGHRDPFVCLWAAVGPENELYFFQEYYTREGRSMREHAMKIKAGSEGLRVVRTVGDPQARQSIEDLCHEGVSCDSANNDRQAGRMRVLEYTAITEDAPPPFPLRGQDLKKRFTRMYFFNTMKETLREMKFYRWKEGKKVEGEKEKTEGDDHACDTVRYITMERPSPFKSQIKTPSNSFMGWMNRMKRDRVMQGAR